MDLPLLSASFLALTLTLYVILDGFDLGVGILFLFQPAEPARDHMVDSITHHAAYLQNGGKPSVYAGKVVSAVGIEPTTY